MGVRLAIAVPLAAAVVGGVAIAIVAARGTTTGLSGESRTWFFVVMPALYVVWHVYGSTLIGSWIVGSGRLPKPIRGWIRGAAGESVSERSALELYAVAPPAGRRRIAGSVAIGTTWLALLTVPVFAMLVGWLFAPGVYEPWEAAVVVAAGIASVAWIGVLAVSIGRVAPRS